MLIVVKYDAWLVLFLPTSWYIFLLFYLFIYFLLIKQQIPYRVEKEAWTKAGQSQTTEREADAGKSRKTQRNLQKGTSFMCHINVTDFLLLTGKIHVFKNIVDSWFSFYLQCICIMRIPLFEMICKIRYEVGFHVCLDDISRYFRVCCVCTMYLPTVIWICWWNHVTLKYVFNQYLWQVEDSVCCVV